LFLCSSVKDSWGKLIGKVDLVMWAKNGADYLPVVMKQIDLVIPPENVCHKILVDDRSTDETVKIAKDFNWTVYSNPSGGIPSGANEALRHVDCDFFVSLEQDIVLSKKWWDVISRYMDDPEVGCAQGIRFSSRRALRILDEWQYGDSRRKTPLVSIDNNMFRTKVIRALGGFPTSCPYCTDSILRNKIRIETSYKWVIDYKLVSFHLRDALRSSIEHNYKWVGMCTKTPYCSKAGEQPSTFNTLRVSLTSPLRALHLAVKRNCPELIWVYPLLRYYQFKAFLRSRLRLNIN
jgi:glycosyltransferase involved in cell wall biosynthesis